MSARDDELGGMRLGRYVIDAWLASGGMADVYRARAHGAAGVVKELAIKRVSSQLLGTERALERFVTEARLSMQLGHANIVAVFDFGRADDGYYLAMEWIDGIDLASLLGRAGDPSPLPTAVVAHVGSQIARALQHAHEQPSGAIVHRDVKPSNVLISRAGDVKLGDFGVAVLVGDERNIAGTRGYMAPEQARGDAPDVRHDLFGLGKVLLEIAVGHRVEDESIEAQLAGLDADLREVVRPMLERDPELRTASAQRAAAALERVTSLAIARGDESPRDALVRLVATATAARTAASESRSRPERLESFALGVTAPAATFGSAAVTRDVEPRTRAESGTLAEAAPVPEPRTLRRTALVVIPIVVLFGLFVASRVREAGEAPRAGRATVAASTERPQPRETSSALRAPNAAQAERSTPRSAAATETFPTPSAPAVPSAPPPPSALTPPSAAASAPAMQRVPDTQSATAHVRAPEAETAEARVPREPTTPASETAPNAAPEARGVLNVAARPWANVFVDGRPAGTTPVLGLSVSAGTHRVRLENDSLGASRTVTVDVPANGRRNVSVTLD